MRLEFELFATTKPIGRFGAACYDECKYVTNKAYFVVIKMSMEISFTSKYQADGHIAVDPQVAMSLREGQRLRVTLEILDEPPGDKCTSSAARHESKEFIDFLKSNVVQGGYREAVITRDFIHENH